MNHRLFSLAAIFCAAFAVAKSLPAADAAAGDMQCPVSGQAASKSHCADFNGGKIYFCCGGCLKEFANDTAQFAAKANLQLAKTGQIKQVGCPFSGQPANSGAAIPVGGLRVAFCCDHCKAKAEKAQGDERIALIFKDPSKGFQPVPK